MISSNNRRTLLMIINYCDELSGTVSKANGEASFFCEDKDLVNSSAMVILTIGELVTQKLTADFKEEHSGIDWRKYKTIRNKLAHAYFQINDELVWRIAKHDIPELKNYCFSILNKK